MIKIGKLIKAKSKAEYEEGDGIIRLIVIDFWGNHESLNLIRLDNGKYVSSGNAEQIESYLNIHYDSWSYYDGDIFVHVVAEQEAKKVMSKYVENIFSISNNKSSYETLVRKIINRFTEIGIVKPENAKTQFMKVTEELGELAEGINKDKPEQIKDSLGDVLVTLILLAEDLNLNLLDCLNSAWNEIKDRKGEVKDGSFVKEEDLDDR